jgi:hypothetical protein
MHHYKMITIDKLLLSLYKNIKALRFIVNVKDLRIMVSLAEQLEQNQFLTENQSKLLLKILNENLVTLVNVEPAIEEIIKNNQWSEPFRVLQRIRRLYINPENDTQLKIEFTFDKKIKTVLTNLENIVQGKFYASGSKNYGLPCTEQNIYLLVKELMTHDFEIDQKLMDFYHEIKEIIDVNDTGPTIKNTKNLRLKQLLEDEIGSLATAGLALLHDRKFRYQYEIFEEISEKSLKNSIAQRRVPKVFISPSVTSLVEIIGALKDLNRLPMLVVFEGHDATINKKSLDFLVDAMEKNGISEDVGIYFRFDKDADSTGFNRSIAEKKYNKNLNSTTQVAGIANNKLPKFMVEMQWKPKSIVSFTTNFKSTKSSVYFNDTDLIIYYTDRQPLSEDVHVIL